MRFVEKWIEEECITRKCFANDNNKSVLIDGGDFALRLLLWMRLFFAYKSNDLKQGIINYQVKVNNCVEN